uniref:Uncharacterized protein n=1 Tax=Clandestinovirus TaxID=2831644 RepID=A0A8F8KLQ5_9VIRU|nr:hypothetical protein KOM_12_163 [Clandestinovirus]
MPIHKSVFTRLKHSNKIITLPPSMSNYDFHLDYLIKYEGEYYNPNTWDPVDNDDLPNLKTTLYPPGAEKPWVTVEVDIDALKDQYGCP